MKKLRIIIETLFLVGISLLFYGIGTDCLGWMAKLQFLPSVSRLIASATALNIAILLFLVILTLLFGRIYCSTICPLGALQDIAIKLRACLGKLIFRKRRQYHFSPERKIVRYGVLVIFAAALIAAVQPLVALIAPYSAYGRIIRAFHPVFSWVGIISFVVIVVFACLGGRLWCNLICPVGTTLGLISKASLFRVRIDDGKCTSCGLCEHNCKASCIDTKNHKVDSSRCVACFDCIGSCHRGAISYSLKKSKASDQEDTKAPDSGRRKFIATGAAMAAAVITKDLAKAKGQRAERKAPERPAPIVPPGAQSVRNFYERCTSCQLCISNCPNGLLSPSKSLEHLMAPEMSYERGWCRPECNVCSSLCPSGAILPMKKGEKLTVSIGTAHINREHCIVNTDGVRCGHCAKHCPVGAIKMVEVEGYKNRQPVVDESLCIGCGACEYLCPARPEPAIVVSGRSRHQRLD